ncbi:MAG: FecR family protein [Candidatus Angelobacter sp.]
MAEAAQWFMELERSDADPRKFIEWQQWMCADSAHQQAYAVLEQQMKVKVKQLRLLPSAEEMTADDYDGSMSVAEWKALPQKVRRGWLVDYGIAAGIAVLSLLAGGFWLNGHYRALHGTFAFHTAAGERREFKLPEGSRITLDADSALNVQLTPERRTLQLARGEAFFEVAKDPTRPFKVRAGNAEVRAVGTAFDVRMSEDRTVVAVTEGKVEVTSGTDFVAAADLPNDKIAKPAVKKHAAKQLLLAAQVSAGQAVSFVNNVGLKELPAAEASLATTWLQGRRQYRNEPLRYVLADLDRYTGKRIEISEGSIGDLKFTGTLDLDNSDAWLKGLSVALPVNITRTRAGGLAVEAR